MRRSALKRKPKKRPTAAEKRHMDRVAALGCVVTRRPDVVLHHIMHMDGKTTRRDNRFVVPLISELHNMGDLSVHALGGEEKFKEVHGVDLVAWAREQWAVSCA